MQSAIRKTNNVLAETCGFSLMFQNSSSCIHNLITFSLDYCHDWWLAWGKWTQSSGVAMSSADWLQAGQGVTLPPSLTLSPVFPLTCSSTDMTDLSQSPSLPAAPALGECARANKRPAPTVLANQSPGELRSPELWSLYLAPWRRLGKQVINHENTQIRPGFAVLHSNCTRIQLTNNSYIHVDPSESARKELWLGLSL